MGSNVPRRLEQNRTKPVVSQFPSANPTELSNVKRTVIGERGGAGEIERQVLFRMKSEQHRLDGGDSTLDTLQFGFVAPN